ncbi:MAG: hypothetical protein AAF296_08725 [Pseudomonadota bacterium]
MKVRANLRLDKKLNAQLGQITKEYGCTKSSILETALRMYLDPVSKQTQEDLALKRLDRISMQLGNLERDLAVTTAALGQYIYYYLTQFEPHPEVERGAAAALGKKRYAHFLQQVPKRVANQPPMSEQTLFPEKISTYESSA